VLLTDLYFSLYIEAALREQWSDEDHQTLQLADCYIYGPSAQNIRVKGLWLDYFKALRSANLYRQDLLADQVVVLFLFTPLREELTAFVRTHNAHPIRSQKSRSQHVSGVPDELYRSHEYKQQGFAVIEHVLNALQGALPEYGIIFPRAKQAVNKANYLDFNAYLAIETLH
jgi:hypothetical protein